ncbi:MAG: fluoride efflux transporter CrcB [Pseudomonadota bacterium]|nr:fluoride efflux transporter CrcB [Pseudomonadota bacterium]|tara:strand:- start:2781 stop:3155 length:375 start_codon:yes stop_codon:yes gene_type:complete
MMNLLAIAIGGAAGSLCRYGMSNGIYFLLGRGFPYGTLAVNILGSIIMGIAYVMMIEKLEVSPEWRMGIIVGLLGAFTTFSAFSIETLELLETGENLKAGLNMFLSVTLCISGCWLGMILARQI